MEKSDSDMGPDGARAAPVKDAGLDGVRAAVAVKDAGLDGVRAAVPVKDAGLDGARAALAKSDVCPDPVVRKFGANKPITFVSGSSCRFLYYSS